MIYYTSPTPPRRRSAPLPPRCEVPKSAYLVYHCVNNMVSWDVYTITNGRREYHYWRVELVVAVAFVMKHGLKIVNEDGKLEEIAATMLA